jgi:hypothetical protein
VSEVERVCEAKVVENAGGLIAALNRVTGGKA